MKLNGFNNIFADYIIKKPTTNQCKKKRSDQARVPGVLTCLGFKKNLGLWA
jgi:hypothetical protein